MIKNWKFLKDLSLILVLIMNLFLLITIDYNTKDIANSQLFLINWIISVIQIVLCTIVLFCCFIERYEISQSKD